MIGVVGDGSSGGRWVVGGAAAIDLVSVVAWASSSASPLLGVVVGVARVVVGEAETVGVVVVVVVLSETGVFVAGVDAGAAIFGVTHTLVGGAFDLFRRLNRFLRCILSCARRSLRICCASAV